MSTIVLWLLAGSPAQAQDDQDADDRDVPALRPTGFFEDLFHAEADSTAYALKLRDKGPSGFDVRVRPRRAEGDLGPPPHEPVVLKVAPWPMFVGGGLKVGARF